MNPSQLISHIKNHPGAVEFQDVIATIDSHYEYTPTRFSNGQGDDMVINEAGKNEGSCKIFAFALLSGLSETETLACFGQYYREDVLNHPQGDDHANIRNFMKFGWDGIDFSGRALKPVKAE